MRAAPVQARCPHDGFPAAGEARAFALIASPTGVELTFLCAARGDVACVPLPGPADWQPYLDRGVPATPAALTLIEGAALLPTAPPALVPVEGHTPGRPPEPGPHPGLIRGVVSRVLRAALTPRPFPGRSGWTLR